MFSLARYMFKNLTSLYFAFSKQHFEVSSILALFVTKGYNHIK